MKSLFHCPKRDEAGRNGEFFKREPVDFAPGEKFDYNNSGYVVLGYIIELVSGASYEDLSRKYL
ncbi:serine hydrolase [Chryseobacterium sp. 1B4]